MKISNIRSLNSAVKHGFNPVLIGAVYLGIIKEYTFNLKEIGKFNKTNIHVLVAYFYSVAENF